MTRRRNPSFPAASPNLEVAPSESPPNVLGAHLLVGVWDMFERPLPGISRVLGAHNSNHLGSGLAAVGIDFTGLSLAVARRSLSWVHDRLAEGNVFPIDAHEEEIELVTEPARLQSILNALVASEARGHAMSAFEKRPDAARTTPVRLTRDGTLLWERSRGAALPEPPFEVQLEGFHSVYQFRFDDSLVVPVPAAMVRVRRRRFRRAPAPLRLRVSWVHPLWKEVTIDAPAVDVSLSGISIETDAVRDVLYPGLRIRDIVLQWKGGASIRCNGVIAHVTQRTHSRDHRVGLRLFFAEGPCLEQWREGIEGLLHTRTTRGAPAPETFWETYATSGYFRLSGKDESDFAERQADFAESQALLATAPQIGAYFARPSERRVEAVAHQISPWAGTWVYYHFCRLPERRPLSAADDTSLMDLYAHAYEFVQSTGGAKWLVTYVQSVARFSRRVYYNLAERYRAHGRASVTPFRAIEVDCERPVTTDQPYDIGSARPPELSALAGRIRSKRPAIYVEATGLGSPDLSIDPIVAEWEAAGLMRKRCVLVARGPSGWPVAGAVIDAVNEGVHLFGLLDMVRLYPLVEGGAAAYPALLTASQEWFLALGKQRFTYFADDEEDPLAASRPGCSDLGSAFVTILPVALLPELLEHVFTLTAHSQSAPGQGPREGTDNDLRLTR